MDMKTEIAGRKTVADWKKFKAQLVIEGDVMPWKEAFNDFFQERMITRYFSPIKVLGSMKNNIGEGFSIVAIQCSLIEFFASTVEGKTYRHRKKSDPPLGVFEYSNSSEMFRSFLRNQAPFDAMFPDEDTARDFYSNVRCALLHEARTRGTWRIRVCQSAKQAIDTKCKIVYRNKVQEAFDIFVSWYGENLLMCRELQQAFIRKFDSLCDA